ncbi:MAG: tetraacyldisaccharide 4'-kinase [Steroidobacteraceae bacterium]|jgi:tetraacyldisaccharide 4'-kinase|nr:tetraacyldisaccharide 4'-kinase [Pseudomonadota bacterium]MBP9130155.1 tetraacyldisaccharide 4'-kinase [Steroidobacteraceae bacterium]
MSLDARLQSVWYGPAWRSLPLWPLALLYRMILALRALAYRSGLLHVEHVDVPVIVVGNLTVGGTGKTPVAAWLARQLEARGRRVGVVLRGYGGSHRGAPRVVTPTDDPRVTGDEALVHARRGMHTVVIGADRVAAARLAAEQGADVVVCDDGLQHVRLARDFEIAVIDGARGLGNRWLLPAGPLREPARELESVHAVVVTDRGGEGRADFSVRSPMLLRAQFAPGDAVNLLTNERRPLAGFVRVSNLHAIAGIGHPEAFFRGLVERGLVVTTHALPDHAPLDAGTLPFPADAIVLMTEKDAVKCRSIARPDWWWVDLEVSFGRAEAAALLTSVLERTGLTGAGVSLG